MSKKRIQIRLGFHRFLAKRLDPMDKGVLVIGGGIAGIQAALDLADSGVPVTILEKDSALGGRMSQLDKTFPTNDCAMCILSPKLVEAGRHPNIQLMTNSELVAVEGEKGNFQVKVLKYPRYVNEELCVGCGICADKCPQKVPNEFEMEQSERKAIYRRFPQAIPMTPQRGVHPSCARCKTVRSEHHAPVRIRRPSQRHHKPGAGTNVERFWSNDGEDTVSIRREPAEEDRIHSMCGFKERGVRTHILFLCLLHVRIEGSHGCPRAS
jgi:heterodisulfide reductase subunit A-like polyferredoxin